MLSSPLLRARETAAELGRALRCEPEADERLAPGSTVDELRDVVAGRGGAVVVVGHQPDCGQIAAELTGAPPRRRGLAVLELGVGLTSSRSGGAGSAPSGN